MLPSNKSHFLSSWPLDSTAPLPLLCSPPHILHYTDSSGLLMMLTVFLCHLSPVIIVTPHTQTHNGK